MTAVIWPSGSYKGPSTLVGALFKSIWPYTDLLATKKRKVEMDYGQRMATLAASDKNTPNGIFLASFNPFLSWIVLIGADLA